jgi:hypothetical protein
MDISGWDDLTEEACTHLEIGKGIGESELETMTRLIWLERLNNGYAIEKAVASALAYERGTVIRKARPAISDSTHTARHREGGAQMVTEADPPRLSSAFGGVPVVIKVSM